MEILSSLKELSTVSGLLCQVTPPSSACSTTPSAFATAKISVPQTPAPLATTAPGEPHVPSHNFYSSEVGQFFFRQCSLIFNLQPLTYASDKVKLVNGLLIIEHFTTASYKAFVLELGGVVNHPNQGGEADTRRFSFLPGFSVGC